VSIRDSLLALLAEGNRYGYELRAEFENRTGGAWPLNIGQVYSTLDRLERDGLVTRHEADDDRQVHYSLTNEGRTAVETWWTSPVPVERVARDDVALKVALAIATPGVDAADVIHTQRRSAMSSLQVLTRAKNLDTADPWGVIADALIFRAEAEVRWLDHTEATLARRGVRTDDRPTRPDAPRVEDVERAASR